MNLELTKIKEEIKTLKKDKNRLADQTTGFIQVHDGKLEEIEYYLLSDGIHYSKFIREENTNKLVKRNGR